MQTKPKPFLAPRTFQSFLSVLSADKQAALEKVRKAIRSAAPDAEECISYGIPAFRLHGKFLVGLSAGKTHCSFYPGSALKALNEDLAGYETSKGTIRFAPNRPLPATLVRKLVKARIRQLEATFKRK